MDSIKGIIASLFALMLAALAFFYIFFVGGKNGVTQSILTNGPQGITNIESGLMGSGAAGAYQQAS